MSVHFPFSHCFGLHVAVDACALLTSIHVQEKPDDWAFLKQYSSYHQIDPSKALKTYPPLLMTTSTRDDRVHPYHARSFVKRLQEVRILVAFLLVFMLCSVTF
jgi:dipeptidyl aminopeptidase/acylaminoacyl peptidase